VLTALRAGGPQTSDQLTVALADRGRAIRPATIQVALGELLAANLVAEVGEDTGHRWLALPTTRDSLLEAVDLRGAHDFRHTFATWLEDAGIPARVIDEVMGHEATSRVSQQRGSAMGAHYRHTTPEMAARIATAIEQRLRVVLEVAEQVIEAHSSCSTHRVL
jgi:integrase